MLNARCVRYALNVYVLRAARSAFCAASKDSSSFGNPQNPSRSRAQWLPLSTRSPSRRVSISSSTATMSKPTVCTSSSRTRHFESVKAVHLTKLWFGCFVCGVCVLMFWSFDAVYVYGLMFCWFDGFIFWLNIFMFLMFWCLCDWLLCALSWTFRRTALMMMKKCIHCQHETLGQAPLLKGATRHSATRSVALKTRFALLLLMWSAGRLLR